MVKIKEGLLHRGENYKFGVVVSSFTSAIVDRLVEGAIDCLTRHGVKEENIFLFKVPGAW